MKDTIYRRDAINALYKYSFVSKDVIEEEIKAIPSTDEPQGEWEIYVVSPFDGEDCRCPKCGETGCAPSWNYCPNCGIRLSGARMKGTNDEDNH